MTTPRRDADAERLAEVVGDFLEACGWHWCTECGKFHISDERQEDRPEQAKLAAAYNRHRAILRSPEPSEGRDVSPPKGQHPNPKEEVE